MKKLSFLFLILFLGVAQAQNKKICITIDDLLATPLDMWQYKYITDSLLKTFKKNNIQAVGFVNEYKLYINVSST